MMLKPVLILLALVSLLLHSENIEATTGNERGANYSSIDINWSVAYSRAGNNLRKE